MGIFDNAPFHEEKLHKKWSGKRRLVVSFDIGATHTAVAAALLTPGSTPKIIHVSRWPGQDRMYEQKVPTVVLYNRSGKAITCGAEALSPKYQEMADAQGWTLAKNFKLRLHPAVVAEKNKLTFDDLPPGIQLKDVYTDFMRYIFSHTREYLKSNTGSDPWTSEVEIIYAHPNLWGKPEQEFLLEIAVSAHLIPDTEAARSKRVYFVEEAEASARYCISTTTNPFATRLKKGSKFIVCDAGGSTVDITTYEIKSMSSDRMSLKELVLPSCVAAGGLHVDEALRQYLEGELRSSQWDPDRIQDCVRDGVRDFEQHGKRQFDLNNKQDIHVRIAERNVNSVTPVINHGEMLIPRETVRNFFSLCVDKMVMSLNAQLKSGIEHIILTGGLGESPHVKNRLEDAFRKRCGIVVANSSDSKAVAVGALMLVIGGGSVIVDRLERPFETWLTNFATLARVLGGIAAVVGALLPLLL